MIVDAFLEWSQRAPRERRIEAADALARSYLHSCLDEAGRRKVLTALFALVDDPSVAVRERLAEVFADRQDAPRAIVLRLIDDVPSVSAELFARSPLLMASHLAEALQRGEARLEVAIAGRSDLDDALVGMLLQQGCEQACRVLAANTQVVLSEHDISTFIDRFAGDASTLEALQAQRNLSPEQHCLLVAACAQAYHDNPLVRAFIPGKRLGRLTDAARQRALVEVLVDLDGPACWRVCGALHVRGVITPAFVLRVALCGHVEILEALVGRLCDVSMDRVRSAFVHRRPVVAASLLKKASLGEDVSAILSMALVLARELAGCGITWTPAFFCETLMEVIDQRSHDEDGEGFEACPLEDETVALCHSIAADILQAQARSQAQACQLNDESGLVTITMRDPADGFARLPAAALAA